MNCMQKDFKGVVHPKNVIMSSHTHPLVVSNLYEFISSAERKRRYFKIYMGNQTVDGPHWHLVGGKYTLEVNGAHQLLLTFF